MSYKASHTKKWRNMINPTKISLRIRGCKQLRFSILNISILSRASYIHIDVIYMHITMDLRTWYGFKVLDGAICGDVGVTIIFHTASAAQARLFKINVSQEASIIGTRKNSQYLIGGGLYNIRYRRRRSVRFRLHHCSQPYTIVAWLSYGSILESLEKLYVSLISWREER